MGTLGSTIRDLGLEVVDQKRNLLLSLRSFGLRLLQVVTKPSGSRKLAEVPDGWFKAPGHLEILVVLRSVRLWKWLWTTSLVQAVGTQLASALEERFPIFTRSCATFGFPFPHLCRPPVPIHLAFMYLNNCTSQLTIYFRSVLIPKQHLRVMGWVCSVIFFLINTLQ